MADSAGIMDLAAIWEAYEAAAIGELDRTPAGGAWRRHAATADGSGVSEGAVPCKEGGASDPETRW